MKYIILSLIPLILLGVVSTAEARTVYYEGAHPVHYNVPIYGHQPQYGYQAPAQSEVAARAALIAQINRLLAQLHTQQYYYQPYTYYTYYPTRNNNGEPDVDTERAGNVSEYSAQLRGSVDMNDFKNGLVFFAYGEDEDQVEDIADDYDEYRDIDEDGDDLQKVLIDSDLDEDYSYRTFVSGLDDDTEYFYSICVEFKDEDDDEKIICGGVEDFETDRD